MNNLKIGNITYNKVETIKVKNADNESEYIEFKELKEQEKSIEITKNGTTEVLPDSGKTLSKVTVVANISANVIEKSIIANGTYSASSDSVDGYSSVEVNVPLPDIYWGASSDL